MSATETKLLAVLRQVSVKAKEADLTARLTGENFNVFNILSLSTNEVRTHSAFLAELLKPNGSHGQGVLFLNLFLSRFGIAPRQFEADKSKVYIEYSIGPVVTDESVGGRIDILLEDAHHNRVMIENKIYAGDQPDQLLRYHNYDHNAVLFYLTLFGDAPSKYSTGKTDFPVRLISYKEDVLEWLYECYKCSAGLPVIRETIFQYVNLIRQLTGMTARSKVMEEAKKLISENPELLASIIALGKAWPSIVGEVKTKYTGLIAGSGINARHKTPDGKYYIEIGMSEDSDGQYIGVNLLDSSTNKPVENRIANNYSKTLKSIVSSAKPNQRWNIGWYNPPPFMRYNKFESLPPEQILSYYTDEKCLQKFVASIKEKSDEIVDQLVAVQLSDIN